MDLTPPTPRDDEMILPQHMLDAGYTVVKVLSPLEAVGKCPHTDRIIRLHIDHTKRVIIDSIPFDHHTFVVEAQPGKRNDVVGRLWQLGFGGVTPANNPNVFETTYTAQVAPYALDEASTVVPAVESVLAVPDVKACIYKGSWWDGTRYEYKEGELLVIQRPESN